MAYLHHFLSFDCDFNVCCDKQGELLFICQIRKTRRFTLHPHLTPSDEVGLYISPVRTDAESKRVRTLLKYYMTNPQGRRPYIRRMPFTRCQDSAVLYLDYGEYVLLPIPLGISQHLPRRSFTYLFNHKISDPETNLYPY